MRLFTFFFIFLVINCNILFAYDIKIKDIVITDKKILTIGDVAECNGKIHYFDIIKNQTLLNIESYPKYKKITKQKLLEALSNIVPNELISNFYIPEYIEIYKGKMVLTKDILMKILNQFVTYNTPYIKGDKIIRDVSTPEFIILGSNEKIAIKPVNEKLKPGHNSVSFLIIKKGKQIRSRPAKFFLDVYSKVPCAVRPLNRGETLTIEKITFMKKNLAYLPKDIWNGVSGPFRIKIPIGTHQPITLGKLEPLPVVSKGQKIKLVYSTDNVVLKTMGMAMEDGKIGDIIKVVNLQSKRYIFGKIKDKDTVEVR